MEIKQLLIENETDTGKYESGTSVLFNYGKICLLCVLYINFSPSDKLGWKNNGWWLMHASDQPRSLVFARAHGTGRGQQITSRWLMLPGQLLPLIKLGGSPPRYRLAFVIKTSQPKLRPVGFTSFVSSSGFLSLLSLEPAVSWLREVAIVSIIDRSYQSTLRSSNLREFIIQPEKREIGLFG